MTSAIERAVAAVGFGNPWFPIRDGDPRALAVFRRHYSSRINGKGRGPGILGPGEKMLLMTLDSCALWAWLRPNPAYRLDGVDGPLCTIFRNESPLQSSDLIRAACDLAWQRWPGETLYTYIDPVATAKRRSKQHEAGWCFIVAGFERSDRELSTRGLVQLRHYAPKSSRPSPTKAE